MATNLRRGLLTHLLFFVFVVASGLLLAWLSIETVSRKVKSVAPPSRDAFNRSFDALFEPFFFRKDEAGFGGAEAGFEKVFRIPMHRGILKSQGLSREVLGTIILYPISSLLLIVSTSKSRLGVECRWERDEKWVDGASFLADHSSGYWNRGVEVCHVHRRATAS